MNDVLKLDNHQAVIILLETCHSLLLGVWHEHFKAQYVTSLRKTTKQCFAYLGLLLKSGGAQWQLANWDLWAAV